MQLQDLRVVCATLRAPLMSNEVAARKSRAEQRTSHFPVYSWMFVSMFPDNRRSNRSPKLRISLSLSFSLAVAQGRWTQSSRLLRARTKMKTGVTFDVFNSRYRGKCVLRQLCGVSIITTRHRDSSPWLQYETLNSQRLRRRFQTSPTMSNAIRALRHTLRAGSTASIRQERLRATGELK